MCRTIRKVACLGVALATSLASAKIAHAQTVVYEDDFETTPITGWSSALSFFDADYTRFHGRFDNSPSQTARTFSIPTGTDRVEIEFDFYRIDSWDNNATWGFDRLEIEVGGTQIFSLPFLTDQSARNGVTGNVTWSIVPQGPPINNIGNSSAQPWYSDQTHRISLVVDGPGATLPLVLRTALNQGGNDESGGFDNISVIAFVSPVITAAKSVQTASFFLPGDAANYTISANNVGGAVAENSIVLIDSLPPEVIFDGSVPVSFADDVSLASGLSCCTAAQVSYSDTASGTPVFGYTPTGPLDPAVRHIRIAPSGAMRSGVSDPVDLAFTFATVIE